MEVETWSEGKPSSPHADSPDDSQCAQYSTGDARMYPAVNPYAPLYAQIFIGSAQNEKWSQSDIDLCDPIE